MGVGFDFFKGDYKYLLNYIIFSHIYFLEIFLDNLYNFYSLK